MKLLRIRILIACIAFLGTSLVSNCLAQTPNEPSKIQSRSENNAQSKKGHWSDEDKERLAIEIEDARPEVEEVLGDQTDAYIACYLKTLEDNYENFEAANSDAEGCTYYAEQCATYFIESFLEEELNSNESVRGHWSDADKKRAQVEIEKVKSEIEESLGEQTDDYIACYLLKVENYYENFDAANVDEPGCTKLARQCIDELDQ